MAGPASYRFAGDRAGVQPDVDADPVERPHCRRGRIRRYECLLHRGLQRDGGVQQKPFVQGFGGPVGGLGFPFADDRPDGPEGQPEYRDHDPEPPVREHEGDAAEDDREYLDQLERQGVAVDRVGTPYHRIAVVD